MSPRKFRGRIKSDDPVISKRWAYGGLFYVGERAFIVPDDAEIIDDVICQSELTGFVEVIPETVGQFTGLHDKNGKDLDWWEGDIFARASDRTIEGKIVYDLGCFWLDRIRGGRNLLYECVDWNMCKVGNIHEELIEEAP